MRALTSEDVLDSVDEVIKSMGYKRNKSIEFRVTKKEKAKIIGTAKKMKMSVSEYIRMCATKAELI